ncbi:hypothetical protein AVEN_38889-1, partial [Araneus ventricosus]
CCLQDRRNFREPSLHKSDTESSLLQKFQHRLMAINGHSPTHSHWLRASHYCTHQGSEALLTYPAAVHLNDSRCDSSIAELDSYPAKNICRKSEGIWNMFSSDFLQKKMQNI